MKKRKIFLIASTLALSASLAFALVGCKKDSECTHDWANTAERMEPTCVTAGSQEQKCSNCGETQTIELSPLDHDFAKEWTTDENGHWHVCSRENCGVKSSEANHADDNEDHKCDDCNLTVSEHSGGTATCTEQATCGVCGEKYGTALGHDFGATAYEWNADNTVCTATRTCSRNCGEEGHTERADSTKVTPNVTQAQTCVQAELTTYTATFDKSWAATQTKEDVETKTALDHDFAKEWTTDENGHWHVCSRKDCGAKSSEANHADDNKDHKCDDCSLTISEHSGGTATCTEQATCGVCGEKYGTALDHDFSKEWSFDEKSHWHVCSRENCEQKDSVAEHDFENGYCKTCKKEDVNGTVGLSYTYRSSSDSYAVKGYTGKETEIRIPYFFDDGTNGLKPVKAIENNAFQSKSTITSIVVAADVTSIGEKAFYSCYALANITLPKNSLTSVGSYAFYYCYTLTSIDLPESITWFGSRVFYNCSGLTSIDLPSGITSIEESMFYSCSKLESIDLPSGITSIGKEAFRFCKKLESIAIPAATKTIEENAFSDCSALENVTFADGGVIETIGKLAFLKCAIASFSVPASLKAMGSGAFGQCPLSAITVPSENEYFKLSKGCLIYVGEKHTLADSQTLLISLDHGEVSVDESVKVIGAYAFSGRANVTEAVIPAGVVTIDICAFLGSSLSSVTFEKGSSLTTLGGSVFAETKIKTITVPAGVTEISYSLFKNASSLTEVIFEGTITKINGYAFYNTRLSQFNVPDSVKTISEFAFAYMPALTAVSIGSGLTELPASCFYCCSALSAITFSADGQIKKIDSRAFKLSGISAITIPASVETIGEEAFMGSSLAQITFAENNKITSIGQRAFSTCENLTEIILPDGITSISYEMFEYCAKLQKVTVPKTLKLISGFAFQNCGNLAEIAVKYRNGDNVVYGTLKDSNVTVISRYTFKGCSSLRAFELPANLTTIDSYAFSGCKSFESAAFPATLSTLGYASFNSSGLKSVSFAEGCAVKSIADNAFSNCAALESVTLHVGLETIGESAFTQNKNLCSIVIPASVTSIKTNAFQGCTSLVKVVNESNLEITAGSSKNGYVGYFALSVNNANDELKKIGDYMVFVGAEQDVLVKYLGSDARLTLPDKFVNETYKIAEYAFRNNMDLVSVVISNGVTEIGYGAFSTCYNLLSVTVGENVKKIDTNAFNYDYKLRDVVNLSSLSFNMNSTSYLSNGGIAVNAFSVAKTSALKIDSNGFAFVEKGSELYLVGYVGNDEHLVLPQKFNGKDYNVANYAFYLDKSIRSVVIADCVKTIGDRAFNGCENLLSVTLGTGVTELGKNSFDGACKLAEIIDKSGLKLDLTSTSNDFGYIAAYAHVVHSGESKIRVFGDYAVLVLDDRDILIDYVGTEKHLILPQNFEKEGYVIGAAFRNNQNLSTVTLSDGVTEIGNRAFENCGLLTVVKASKTSRVQRIGKRAFKGCAALQTVYVSSAVSVLDEESFSGCRVLTRLCYYGTVDWAPEYGRLWRDAAGLDGLGFDIYCYNGILDETFKVTFSLVS